MDHNGFYSFDQNTIPHASMSPFESQQNNAAAFAPAPGGSFTAEQTPANDFVSAEGAMNSAAQGEFSFNNGSFHQPASNHLWNPNPMSNTYEEVLQGQYAFNESALPQPSVTNAFNLSDPTSAVDDNYPTWGASTFIDQQAFQDTLTEISSGDWSVAGLGQNALSGDTTGGWQPTLLTGSALNAPFEVDESDSQKYSHDGAAPVQPIKHGRDRLSGVSSVDNEVDSCASSLRVRIGRSSATVARSMDEPLTCSWQGCSKTKPFKTPKLLETHIENIHLNPLYCTQPDCTYRLPFPGKGDLDRHLATKHGIGRLFRCPRRSCDRHTRPFGRKDKLRKHVSQYGHGVVHCQYDHCRLQRDRGLLTKEDVSKHEASADHGAYECAIESCEGSVSCFSEAEFEIHLKYTHYIDHDSKSLLGLLKPGQNTITAADVNNHRRKWYLYGQTAAKTSCGYCDGNRRNNIS